MTKIPSERRKRREMCVTWLVDITAISNGFAMVFDRQKSEMEKKYAKKVLIAHKSKGKREREREKHRKKDER